MHARYGSIKLYMICTIMAILMNEHDQSLKLTTTGETAFLIIEYTINGYNFGMTIHMGDSKLRTLSGNYFKE